jgi:AraC-like DNA-binding protein
MYSERPSGLPGGVLWSNTGLAANDHLVLPDGCSDLIFDGRQLLIAGPDTVAQHLSVEPDTVVAHLSADDTVIGLRMSSGIGPALWGVPGSELVDRRVALRDIWPQSDVDRLTEQVAAAEDAAAVLVRIAARRWRANPPDRAMIDIAARLRGGSTVASAASTAGFSERQLHRRSLIAYGYGAKTLGRVLRLTVALEAARAGAGFAAVAAGTGYADQAHLSRDVRALTGRTLTDLVAR